MLGQGAIEADFFGFSEPLTFGRKARLVGGADQASLEGGAIEVTGPRAEWSGGHGWTHAVEVTGFGLVQALYHSGGGAVDVARFEQEISLPPDEGEGEGLQVHIIDDAGVEQARISGRALTENQGANSALEWSLSGKSGVITIAARVVERATRESLRSVSVRWQLGPDAVDHRFGGLGADQGALGATCPGALRRKARVGSGLSSIGAHSQKAAERCERG